MTDISTTVTFNSLHNAGIEAAKKVASSIVILNTAFPDGKFTNKTGDYKIFAKEEKGKTSKKKAREAIAAYVTSLAGENSAKQVVEWRLEENDDGSFSMPYHFEANDIKESRQMKESIQKVFEADDSKPTFEITPQELVGKLHQAAMEQVLKKYGADLALFNTAIDTNQDPPLANLDDGAYKIKIECIKSEGKKADKKKAQDALKEYLTWFAGKDVAHQASKPKWFIFKSKIAKGEDKNDDGSVGFTVHYTIGRAEVNTDNVEKSIGLKLKELASKVKSKDVGGYKAMSKWIGDKKNALEMKELMQLQFDKQKVDKEIADKAYDVLIHDYWADAKYKDDFENVDPTKYKEIVKKFILTEIKDGKKYSKITDSKMGKVECGKLMKNFHDFIVKSKADIKGESIYYSFEGCLTAIVESTHLLSMLNMVVESRGTSKKYKLVESKRMREHRPERLMIESTRADKFVNAVCNEKNVKAYQTLEDMLKEKAIARLTKVLSK